MEEIVKHINDTNASYRQPNAGDAKNTDLFLDNEHYSLFKDSGEQITVRYNKENLTKAILFISSILPRKFDQSATHELIKFSKEFVLNQLAIIDALFIQDGKPVNTFTQVWNARKDVPQKNGLIDKRFYFNGLLKDIIYTDYKGIQRKTKFTIRNYFAGGYSDLHIIKASDGIFDILISNANIPSYDNKEEGLEELEQKKENKSLQLIYYGAPGTGKSHHIKKDLKDMNVPNENIFRTTFHPDSDYSTFVGAYKPTMKKQYRYDGKVKARYYEDDDLAGAKQNDIIIDKVIQYDFVPQTFIKAYIQAYKNPDENIYLIIEEINRGNCAQIFGDLFQLLDRDENGVSEYPIKADSDLKIYLEGELGIGHDGIKDGELCLPQNLYIWATMNTSDQSLFPIDSAFKRRWDWEYEPIKYKNTDWMIEIGDYKYSWTSFQQIINDKIFEATSSEDKMLGDYFVKPCNNVITEKQFINKVLFYLWNDVCKDGDGDIFRTDDNKDVKFSDLYKDNGTETIKSMMKYLGVKLLSEDNIEDIEDFIDDTEIDEQNNNVDINDSNSTQQNNKFDYSKYSLNGSGSYSKGAVVYEAVKLYCDKHKEQDAEYIVRQWLSLGIKVPNLIETESVHVNRKENTRDLRFDDKSKLLLLANGQSLYVSNQFNVERITDFITKVNAQSWGIRIEKI